MQDSESYKNLTAQRDEIDKQMDWDISGNRHEQMVLLQAIIARGKHDSPELKEHFEKLLHKWETEGRKMRTPRRFDNQIIEAINSGLVGDHKTERELTKYNQSGSY